MVRPKKAAGKKSNGSPRRKSAQSQNGDASITQLQKTSSATLSRKKSRVYWTKEMNSHLVRSFFMAMKISPEKHREEMFCIFRQKFEDKKITEKKLFDQKRFIFSKAKNCPDPINNWLTAQEIQAIQREVDSEDPSASDDPENDVRNKTSKCQDVEIVTGHQEYPIESTPIQSTPTHNNVIRLSGPEINEIATKHLVGNFPAVGRFVQRLIKHCPDIKKIQNERRDSQNDAILKRAAEKAKKGMLPEQPDVVEVGLLKKDKSEGIRLLSKLEETEEDRLVYQKKLRKYAAPKIINFFKQCLAVRFILQTQNNLPSNSPLDNNWKDLSILFKKASKELQVIHHAWRCRKYRQSVSEERKKILSEKLKASEIFRNKKSNYPESVGVPFNGDAIQLASNPNWSKVKAKQETQIQLNFVENVTKINRADGKEAQKVLVLSDTQLVLLHPTSFNILYQINLTDVQKVSCTPHKDGLLVFHLNSQDKTNKALQKGDFVVNCSRMIEVVSKLALQYKALNQRELDVAVSDKFAVTFKGKPMEFVVTNQNNSEKPICRRKGNTINVGC